MVRSMCGVQLKDRKGSTDLMFMLGLCETIANNSTIASSAHNYDHVLRREDSHALRRALDFKARGQRKKGGQKLKKWEKQVDEECLKIGLRRVDALCPSKWSVGVNQITAGLR